MTKTWTRKKLKAKRRMAIETGSEKLRRMLRPFCATGVRRGDAAGSIATLWLWSVPGNFAAAFSGGRSLPNQVRTVCVILQLVQVLFGRYCTCGSETIPSFCATDPKHEAEVDLKAILPSLRVGAAVAAAVAAAVTAAVAAAVAAAAAAAAATIASAAVTRDAGETDSPQAAGDLITSSLALTSGSRYSEMGDKRQCAPS